MLPVPTVAYLAQFTGRDEASFTAFADQALIQSTLLFSVTTNLDEYPDDEDLQQLGINAILEMADRIYLEQPYAAAVASPFQSESIGSYSYAKGSYAAKAKDKERTGLFWWDLAVDQLSLIERSLVASGGIDVFEHDSMYTTGDDDRIVLSPSDLAQLDRAGGYVNAELNPRPRL